jgi:GT2 family glycosyltransferase
LKITAIIPTFNEEIHIEEAILSISFADEIIVIDSFSTDATVTLAKKHNVKIVQRVFDDFSSQKNFAISKASNDWVLLLDADERIEKPLKEEIIKTINANSTYSAFYIYRNFFFKEKRLRYSGWQRDKVIRLFRKEDCRYKGKVHEEIYTEGEIGFLSEKINHYSYKEYNVYKDKLKSYAKLQAQELLEKGKFVTPYHLFIKPLARFFIQFFIQGGFLDGYQGFVISWTQAFGVWRRYIEVLKFKYRINKGSNPIVGFNPDINEKDVSIIIVNYKSWKHLKNCLDTLIHSTEENYTFEVVIVDNKSDDGKLKEFSDKYPQFKFIENSGNNGFANGCNTGALHSIGSHLLFLNPDTLASEDAIGAMLTHLQENSNYGIVSCGQLNNKGSYEDSDRIFPNTATLFGLPRAVYRTFKKKTTEKDNVLFPDWVSGSVVFISRNWFQKVTGWNEDYWMYFEDVDLCKKVRNQGGEIALLKNVNIIHNHGGASRINIKTASITKTEVIISKHIYLRNHFNGFKRFILLLLVIGSNIISKLLLAMIGIVFFFIPKLKLNIYLFVELVRYYFQSIRKGSWLSKKSMNLPFKKKY